MDFIKKFYENLNPNTCLQFSPINSSKKSKFSRISHITQIIKLNLAGILVFKLSVTAPILAVFFKHKDNLHSFSIIGPVFSAFCKNYIRIIQKRNLALCTALGWPKMHQT